MEAVPTDHCTWRACGDRGPDTRARLPRISQCVLCIVVGAMNGWITAALLGGIDCYFLADAIYRASWRRLAVAVNLAALMILVIGLYGAVAELRTSRTRDAAPTVQPTHAPVRTDAYGALVGRRFRVRTLTHAPRLRQSGCARPRSFHYR